MILAKLIDLVEHGKIPDTLTRTGIKGFCLQRLLEERTPSIAAQKRKLWEFSRKMRQEPVAVHTDKANEQHYELPPEFFVEVLGPHLKYSCCHFPPGIDTLEAAEASMLGLTCERAELQDGQKILELGCGWGSLTLWMAQRYPNSAVTAVSNSAPQREFIETRAQERGLSNLTVITQDMNDFQTEPGFDRVVSVEMFEHMRNWGELLGRVAAWLKEDGKFFFHIFTHRTHAYTFETEGEDNWMGKYFFTGGIMPAHELPYLFQDHLLLEEAWAMPGTHYHHTADAWLANMDAKREQLIPVLAKTYGPEEAEVWFHRWRMFFLATSGVWGFRGGNEWLVSHYRFSRR
jgi:cyclopropane-fatty-acyl-phospholipid synthase